MVERNTKPNISQPELATSDLLDLSALQLPQNFEEAAGIKKILNTIPVRKPNRQEFIRVHPDEGFRFSTLLLEVKEDRECFLVDPSLQAELPGEMIPKMLFTTINRQGVLFLWPIRLPGRDGRVDHWNRSAMEAAELAMENWVVVKANMALGAYEVFAAAGEIPPPNWPEKTFQELASIAFKGKFIQDPNHIILQRLKGRV